MSHNVPLTDNPDAPQVRLIANLWFISCRPDLLRRVNGQTLNALRNRGWIAIQLTTGSDYVSYVITPEGHNVLNTFDYDAHPSARIIFKGLETQTKKPKKQAAATRQKREIKPKATPTLKDIVEAQIKPVQSRREAVKEAAEMFVSRPGVVVLTPELINHPDIDSHTLGVIAWCASQTPAPTIEQVAQHLDMTPAYVRLLVKDVANAGFEMRVAS